MSDARHDNFSEKNFLALFQEVTRAITVTLNVDEVLRLIVQKVPAIIGVDAATIRLLDPSGKKLFLAASHGLSREYLGRGPVDTEESITEALSGSPAVVYDAVTDRRIQYPDEAAREGVKSILALPFAICGKIIGVLRLLTKTPRRFRGPEIEFAAALAEQCGIAIENARMYQDQEQQLRYFETLNRIGKALNSTTELQEILDLIVTRLPGVMNLKGCTIRLLDPLKGHLELMAASGLSREYLARGSIDDELGTHQALQGEPVMIYDAATDPHISYGEEAGREGVASILAVPIMVKKRIIGVLRLLSAEHRKFSSAAVNFAMAVAEQGGIAIRNAINYDKISKLVTELEQHEHFLQNIIDSLNAELVVIDPDYRIIMVNKVFLAHHGGDEERVVGRPCREVIRLCEPDDCPLDRVISTGEAVVCVRQVREGGRQRYFEVMASPVTAFGSDRGIDYIIQTIRDITSHIRLQEEHREKEKLAGVVEMARTAAHELNTPMFAALGTAQLLIEETGETDPLHGELATIIRSLKTMAELTGKMTRITRYEAKDYVGDVRIVDLGKASRQ